MSLSMSVKSSSSTFDHPTPARGVTNIPPTLIRLPTSTPNPYPAPYTSFFGILPCLDDSTSTSYNVTAACAST